METLAFDGDETNRAARYRDLLPQLAALVEGEPDLIANLANIAAALKECIAAASWVGFYRWQDDELVLGPFQGKIACVRIAAGRGVCGAAVTRRETIIVPDVEAFAGHIACDGGSRSEIVVPIVRGDRLLGVLDVDSYALAAFDEIDAAGLTLIVALVAGLAW